MSRPDFPRPYTPLTPGMINRIIENQRVYDENPERWERIEREREEERRQEAEREYYEQNKE